MAKREPEQRKGGRPRREDGPKMPYHEVDRLLVEGEAHGDAPAHDVVVHLGAVVADIRLLRAGALPAPMSVGAPMRLMGKGMALDQMSSAKAPVSVGVASKP